MPRIDWPRLPRGRQVLPGVVMPGREVVTVRLFSKEAEFLRRHVRQESRRLGYPVSQGTILSELVRRYREELDQQDE